MLRHSGAQSTNPPAVDRSASRWGDRRWWLVALVALVALGADLAVWRSLRARDDKLLQARFYLDADDFNNSLRSEMARNVETLTAVAAFYESSDFVERAEFRRFLAPLMSHRPSLLAVEWRPRVHRGEREAFETRLKEETGVNTGIRIWDAQDQQVPAPVANEYFPVGYVEPLASNRSVLGVDSYPEPSRRKAMTDACETGDPMAAPWQRLRRLGPTRSDTQGVLIFVPVYSKPWPMIAIEDRRKRLIGYVVGVMWLAEGVQRAARSLHEAGLEAVLFDGTADTPGVKRFVYESRPASALRVSTEPWHSPPGGIRKEDVLNVAGRQWQVICIPSAQYIAAHHTWVPLMSLLVGFALGSLLVGLVAVLVSQNVLVARQVAERTAALRRSNEQLEEFAYVASHDLQEPLRAVAGYCQLLSRRYQGRIDSDADEFIKFAVDGATRMKTLINDLLAYSRVSTHGQPFAPTDLNEALARARDNLRAAIEESSAVVTSDRLPVVPADSTQMVQLLQNLLGNAIKYRSQQPPVVHISVEEQPDHWLLKVRDNGIGIDPQFAERIFVIFQRLHTRDEYPGTGVGLAICQQIVVRHGGRIGVESQPGAGATFWCTLAKHGEARP